MKLAKVGLLSLALLALIAAPVLAEDEAEDAEGTDEGEEAQPDTTDEGTEDNSEEEEQDPKNKYYHPLTDMPTASLDVTTGFSLVTHPSEVMSLGDKASVLCGMRNSGDETFTVQFVQGSLNNPFMFSEYVTNFTEKVVNLTLAPKSELSVAFGFDVPEFGIRVGEFTTAITVFYSTGEGDEMQNYSNTFYNGTITVNEAHSPISSRTIFLYLLVIGCGGLAYMLNNKNEAAELAKSTVSEAGTEEHGNEHEDILAANMRSSGRATGSTERRKAKSSKSKKSKRF